MTRTLLVELVRVPVRLQERSHVGAVVVYELIEVARISGGGTVGR